MELPNIGDQCSEKNCKQLDFLPIRCKCGLIFCLEHFSKHSSECISVQIHNEPNLQNAKPEYICSHSGCKNRSYVPLVCDKCSKQFCVTHRHVAECYAKDPEEKAEELRKFLAPAQEFENIKKEIDKKLDQSINQAKKNPKTSQMANKVQLMRIKNKATGLKSIPAADRIYFNIQYPKSFGNKVSPIFASKTWTLGRVIDAVAEECKVKNNNNQSNAPKLRLFHKTTGGILSLDLTSKMETLLSEQVIIDGQDFILEYVSDDCLYLDVGV